MRLSSPESFAVPGPATVRVPAVVVLVIATATAPLLIAAGPGALALGAATLALVGLLLAFRFGRSMEAGGESRRQTAMVADLCTQVDVRVGLKQSIGAVFDALVTRFDARHAIAVVRDSATGQVSIWRGGARSPGTPDAARVEPIDQASLANYMFLPSAEAWSVHTVQGRPDILSAIAFDADGGRVPGPSHFPQRFLEAVGPFTRLMAYSIESPEEWNGRVFLIDPAARLHQPSALALGRRFIQQITPIVNNVAAVHRIRARSAANERARVGRELHDGIIQSVMGVEMQLHELALRVGVRSKPLGQEVDRLAALLRDEVSSVRDLMHQMRPLEPDRLIDTLEDLINRFQYETGVSARFITQFDHIDLPPHACREVMRVVQEALVNVRKHARAHNVVVRLAVAENMCRLSIDDDGCGFPFTGCVSSSDAQWSVQPPRVITERVRLLGGNIEVVSVQNQGARLDISIPLRNAYAHSS